MPSNLFKYQCEYGCIDKFKTKKPYRQHIKNVHGLNVKKSSIHPDITREIDRCQPTTNDQEFGPIK